MLLLFNLKMSDSNTQNVIALSEEKGIGIQDS